MNTQRHSEIVDEWIHSDKYRLEPEEAVAILRSPEVMAKHDPKIIRLVKLLRFASSPEFAGMLKREIRVRRLTAQILDDPFLENAPSHEQLL